MMKILITNDDGVGSPALPRLANWAKKYGEVTVVAPKKEQSGKSQAIDFRNAIEIKKVIKYFIDNLTLRKVSAYSIIPVIKKQGIRKNFTKKFACCSMTVEEIISSKESQ